ncbi:MAG: carboxypeptidase regulatory-like domain-containing protein [Chloroflexi bacterium]|nr:carboxypeptidase regulatory-like domain-containing protein [Chloroflexota bacterium]
MSIEQIERRYQILAADFRAGRIDEATFISALDNLQFQDKWGRYWMIGSQTGAWYCYDDQDWGQADPRQADLSTPELIQVYEVRPAVHKRSFLGAGAVLAIILAVLLLPLLILPVAGAPPVRGPALVPSPRPPVNNPDQGPGGDGGSGSGSSGGGNQGSSGPTGAILGTVTDLSSGQPGAAIEVSVSGAIVRTDTDGSYSITGLPAGAYTVSPQLHDQGVPAQGPIFVNVDGQNSVTVDLAYYSQAQPSPTDTPQAAIVVPLPTPAPAATPPALPTAGAPISSQPLVIAGLGLLLIGGGVLLRKS